MTPESEALARKGRRSLEAARRLVRDGDYDFAVSRAYYAMFYLAEALLLLRGFQADSHSGVVVLLRREFVQTGLLEPAHARALDEAREERNLGDYDYEEPFTEGRARKAVQRAESFVGAAEGLLSRRGEARGS